MHRGRSEATPRRKGGCHALRSHLPHPGSGGALRRPGPLSGSRQSGYERLLGAARLRRHRWTQPERRAGLGPGRGPVRDAVGQSRRSRPRSYLPNDHLWRFSGPDGDHPVGLVAGADGFLYGVTARGGTPTNIDCAFVGGCGTFFRMTATGVVTVLHNFNSGQDDGSWPNAGIVQGSDGAFYGTTLQGGGYGSAYRISATGSFTLLHRFAVADGINPEGGLIQARTATSTVSRTSTGRTAAGPSSVSIAQGISRSS